MIGPNKTFTYYGSDVQRFREWMRNRNGGAYAHLKMLAYMDGEPYFNFEGADCSLRDYLRQEQDEKAN